VVGLGEQERFGAPYYFGNTVMNTLANELIQRFKDTFEDTLNGTPPEWAWPFKPSIPFIGENYRPDKGLLIYASAENLSWHNNKDNPLHQFFAEEHVRDRYRAQYEIRDRDLRGFFPYVGIQPANDGGLFAAGLFAAVKYGLQQEENPRSFLETIAITNWNKFSIRSPDKNKDIRDIKKLTASLPFVVAELMVLQPGVVLIPRTVWKYLKLQAAMKTASLQSEFLEVPQFNATVVNCRLGGYEEKARRLRKDWQGTPLARWMNNLCGINEGNAWRYIAMLDGILTQK